MSHTRPRWIFFAFFLAIFTRTADANVNLLQCLANINNVSIDGKTDNHGNSLPPSTHNATAITYSLCISECGVAQEPFQWTVFSQQFSAWLLPWLALVSQLPYGSTDKLDNLESMLLTVGSPMLASYALALTILNGRWIAQLFATKRYPNAQNAVRILSSLQQSPIQINTNDAKLASLIVLPQNDAWWAELVVGLDFTHTWSISAASSIAWVIIAYVFTIIDYFSQNVPTTINTNGQSIGTLWLWLLSVVVGWLQISPKCDSKRVNQAIQRANSLAYVATSGSTPCKVNLISEKYAISIKVWEDDDTRQDERPTSPIFNYARFLPWVENVLIVSDAFHNASERSRHHEPVVPGTEWRKRYLDNVTPLATAVQAGNYCLPIDKFDAPPGRQRRLHASIYRMFIASCLAMILQWGTVGAAVTIAFFTPTIGLGCRSGSYLIYGALATVVWIMLVASSILSHYSAINPARSHKGHVSLPKSSRIARWLSIFLRRCGKIIAALNSIWVLVTGIMQFSGFYDRCYCNSSVLGLGKSAYNVILTTHIDIVNMRQAWIGGFSLAAVSAAIFAGFVNLLINPPLPQS